MRLDKRDIEYINLFERMTRARVSDFFETADSLNFLVKAGQMGVAIGKNGANVSKVRSAVSKRVVIVEDADDDTDFVFNIFKPLKISGVDIDREGKVVRVQIPRVVRSDLKRKQIMLIKEFLGRRFGFDTLDLKVV